MEIEIVTVSGYEEVGRQMTAVRTGEDVVIFDAGIDLSKVLIHDDLRTERMHSLDLIDMGAIPDDRVMADVEGEVQAIVPTHGHLDHVGAIPKQAHRYDAPIVGTPMTIEIVKDQLEDEQKFETDNDLVEMEAGERMRINDRVELEFVHVTHSIPGAVNPVLHTPEGAVVYGLDKRLDHTPVLEDPIDLERFREIAREGPGVLAYVEECTNAGRTGRTPSESVARRHVRDVLTSVENYDGGVVATTFASHVARVKSLVEFAREIGRQPLLLGRSMHGYSTAARRAGVADFSDVPTYGHGKAISDALSRVMDEGKGEYLPIVTGHQGEKYALLTRIGRDETPYEIGEGDKVVFAARTLPEPTNEAQRHVSERFLRNRGARIYDEVHVSGHLSAEGHYEMLDLLQPKHVIPAHGELERRARYVDLAKGEGYSLGRDLHLAENGDRITVAGDRAGGRSVPARGIGSD